MGNLYFRAFRKYGAALAFLYPSQIEELIDALERYEENGKIPRVEDCFVRLACMMIICDAQHREREENDQ